VVSGKQGKGQKVASQDAPEVAVSQQQFVRFNLSDGRTLQYSGALQLSSQDIDRIQAGELVVNEVEFTDPTLERFEAEVEAGGHKLEKA
jgi:hypothetical protein